MSLFDDGDGIDHPDDYKCPPDCHCHCHRNKSIQEKWTIELYKGDPKIFREGKDNRISISKTHWILLVPYALFKNFTRIGNLMFLFIALLMLIDSTLTPYANWIVIFPLLFYTLIYVIKAVYLDLFRRRAAHRVNFLKTRRGKKEGGGMDEDVNWMDLKPGDIIYLKKDEMCPADIVVLDTNLPKNKGMICWVDTQSVHGFTSYTMKKAVNATRVEKGSGRKDNFNEYRKILSGKVEYDAPTSDLTKFSGYLKLKKDPRPEHLTVENLVLRGSVIKNADFVFGLCVYTGHDTKVMQNSRHAKEKRSYFENVAERFFLFGAFLVIVCAVASVVVFLADRTQNQFADLYPAEANSKKLFYFLVLYSPGIPIALYGTIDLILLWRRAVLQARLHKLGKAMTSSAKTTAVTVLDPNSLPNLGQVDYCFLDKTGTLTTGDFKIRYVYIPNPKAASKLYKLNTDSIQHRINEFRDKKGKAITVQSQNNTQINLLSQTQFTQPTKDINGHNYPRDQLESPLMMSSQGIELDIADDPEFAPTQNVSNYYKFKENVDTRTKLGEDPKRDMSTSGFEISHLPLLGRRARNDELISPKLSMKAEEMHEPPMSPNETTKLMFNVEMGIMNSNQANIFTKEEDEKAMMQKIDLESPDILDKDKRVSFNVPDPNTNGIPLDQKEPQEKEFSDNDYLIDYFTLGDRQIEEFTRSLAICHSARSRYMADDYVYEVASSDELAMLKFARLLGKGFIVSNRPDNPSEYTVKENGETMKYKILGVNDFTYSRKRFSIVYRTADDEEAVIYAKGPADNMKPALALDDRELEAYDKIVAMFQERGYRAIAIGKRQMKDLESAEYHRQYQNLKMSLYNQTDDLEALARGVETGLKLVGIVALQDELRPEARETIKMLHDSDIKLWMLTGDNQENAMSTGYVTQLLTKQVELQSIKLEKLDDAKALIKNILNTIKRRHLGDSTRLLIAEENMKKKATVISKTVFDNSYKFAISIDGDSLELIFKDPYLKANFTFICALCHSFIGYRFSPAHKKMVLSMVKKSFQHRPITMAIGDGLNDALMLRSADISIELRANRELLPNNAGDIQLTSLGLLKEIMLIDGRNISEKVEKTMHFAFYKSLVIGAPIFFFSYFNGFTGTPLYASLLIFLYSFLFTFFPVLVYGGYDKSEPEQILIKFPALYIDGKKKKDNTWINFIVQSVLEGIIHAAIIYFGGSLFINDTFSSQGLASNLGMSSLAQYFAILIITNMKLYWLFKRQKILSFILTIISMACLVVYLFINGDAKLESQYYVTDAQALYGRSASFVTLLFLIAVSTAISYMIKHYIVERVYQTLYDWCAETNAGEKIEEMTNETISSKVYKPKDLGAIVKNVYKQTELMDPLVQEMLSPADQNANQLGLRKYTLSFFDRRMEKQYKLITSRKAKRSSQIIYVLTLLVFGGYSLGQSLILKSDVYSFSRLGVFLGFMIFGFLLKTDFYRTQYFNVTLFYIFIMYVTKAAFDWTGIEDTVLGAALLPLASQTLFKVSSLYLALLNLVYYVLFEIRIIIRYFAEDDFEELNTNVLSSYSMISFALLLLGIYSIISSLGHIFEKDLRNEHSANANLEVQMNKSNDILSILLPKFIKDKIDKLGGDRNLAEDQGEVTILFCDIMDFDKIIQKEGKRVVNFLDYFFRVFDQYCGTHGIQKIETVGKTYMACAGLKSCEIGIAKRILSIHPTRRVLNLALDMEEAAKQMKYGEGISMRIRIGIHYGRVIAGVIGYHKPQFSLIGDAVNTTSRVCTANNQGQIRMSDEAYKEMMQGGGPGRSEIHFVSKYEEMKGKGSVKVHIVARNTRSTSFKFKVGNAMQKFKEKNAESGILTKAKPDLTKTSNQINVLNSIKQVLNLKEVVNAAGDDPNKANNRNSVQGTPSSSFIKTMKDEGGEYQEYEDDEDKDLVILKPNRYLLTLPAYAQQKAQEFEEDLLSKKRVFQKGTMLGLFVIYLFQTVFFLIIQDEFTRPIPIIVLRVVFIVLMVLTVIFDGILAKRGLHKPAIIIVFLYGALASLLQAYWANYATFRRIELIEVMLLYLVATHGNVLDFLTSIILSTGMGVSFLAIFAAGDLLNIENIFFFFTFIWANLMHVFRYFKMNIKFYNSLQTREKRKMEQNGLVSQLLPVHAAEKYFGDPSGKVDVSDEFEDVTIIYADIKGFTDYSAGVEAKDVVTMLSALFTRFDKVCHRYSLYKVYTIGDCYVVISFVNAANRDPGKEANNMVKMAMSMIEIIREVRKEIKFDELDMRIGIHTGNIIGGIVGTDIVRYDIWGQDVIIANAMESEGVKGHINVSEATKNLLERTNRGLYRFEPHKEVNLEKIGAKVPCYLLYSNQEYEEY